MLKKSKYSDYNLEGFLNDSFFVEWVINKNSKNNFFWEKWISNHPEKLATVLKAKEIIISVEYKRKYKHNEKDFIEVLENILENGNDQKPISKSARYNSKKLLRYVAVITLLFVVGSVWWHTHKNNYTLKNEIRNITVTKETLKGQKLTLILNDGTEIKLNSETKLTYPQKFSTSKREVFLEGEAFFDVTKDSLRPFIIHSGNLTTKVLGTSFNINAYPNQQEITVAVVSGKVQVKKHQLERNHVEEKINLIPNEQVIYNTESIKLEKKPVKDLHKIIAWKNNIIIFHEANFKEIVAVLERFYGVNFEVKKYITMGEKGLFSGEYNNEPLRNVLESLSFAGNFRYSIEKNKVTIY